MTHSDRVKRVAEAMHRVDCKVMDCDWLPEEDRDVAEAAIAASDATLEVTGPVLDAALVAYTKVIPPHPYQGTRAMAEALKAALAAMRGEGAK